MSVAPRVKRQCGILHSRSKAKVNNHGHNFSPLSSLVVPEYMAFF